LFFNQSINQSKVKKMSEIKVIIKNKEVKGFIIDEIRPFVNGKYGKTYYKIGTYLGIIHREKKEIDKLNK